MTAAIETIQHVDKTLNMMLDALQVAARGVQHSQQSVVELPIETLLANTCFAEEPIDVLRKNIQTCRQAAEDFAILTMWIAFEQHLMDRLVAECQKMQDSIASDFNNDVFKRVSTMVKYWRVDDALDLIKPLVGSDMVGQAKQIKRYRDWIAHRNPDKARPSKPDVDTVQLVLTQLISDLNIK